MLRFIVFDAVNHNCFVCVEIVFHVRVFILTDLLPFLTIER